MKINKHILIDSFFDEGHEHECEKCGHKLNKHTMKIVVKEIMPVEFKGQEDGLINFSVDCPECGSNSINHIYKQLSKYLLIVNKLKDSIIESP